MRKGGEARKKEIKKEDRHEKRGRRKREKDAERRERREKARARDKHPGSETDRFRHVIKTPYMATPSARQDGFRV